MINKKKEHVKFYESNLNKIIKSDKILFTNETKIDITPFSNDSIRLSLENKEKLKSGKEESYKLLNKLEKKFESSKKISG